MEIVEDFYARVGDDLAGATLAPIWNRPIHKRDAQGIHGTLFYEYEGNRKHLPVSKREIDRDSSQINQAERALYAPLRRQKED